MLKFFREIRYKYMIENKIGKYFKYAIGEILLVVIGILIALQINNWNENREILKREEYYLKSIKSSLDMSQEEFERVISDAKLISSSADTLFLLLADKNFDLLNGVFLDSLLFTAQDYSLISLNDVGIQEVLNTGSLGIIGEDQIRITLASWNERLHKIRKYESETEYISKDYSNYLNNYVDSRLNEYDSLSSIIIPNKKDDFLDDPKLANYLSRIFITHKRMHEMYTDEKLRLDSLSNKIDWYLAKKFNSQVK